MPFTDISPEPTSARYSNPSHTDLAAVIVTVSIVGVLMVVLVTWLSLRLRRASSQSLSNPHPSRPSFAPSEASSKFPFIRKPLRLSRRQQQKSSWDFADPDPFCSSKEHVLEPAPSPKHRPSPLAPTPAHAPRERQAESGPHSPTTPLSPGTPALVDFHVESPPPAYYPDGTSWPLYRPIDLSPA